MQRRRRAVVAALLDAVAGVVDYDLVAALEVETLHRRAHLGDGGAARDRPRLDLADVGLGDAEGAARQHALGGERVRVVLRELHLAAIARRADHDDRVAARRAAGLGLALLLGQRLAGHPEPRRYDRPLEGFQGWHAAHRVPGPLAPHRGPPARRRVHDDLAAARPHEEQPALVLPHRIGIEVGPEHLGGLGDGGQRLAEGVDDALVGRQLAREAVERPALPLEPGQDRGQRGVAVRARVAGGVLLVAAGEAGAEDQAEQST